MEVLSAQADSEGLFFVLQQIKGRPEAARCVKVIPSVLLEAACSDVCLLGAGSTCVSVIVQGLHGR